MHQRGKVKIISLLLRSWSQAKVTDKVDVSERLVKLPRQSEKEQGILPRLQKKTN